MFDKLQRSVFVLVARLVTKEVRQLREVLQVATDTYRIVHGFDPLYGTPAPAAPTPPDPQRVLHDGDFLSYYLLQELCVQYGIPVYADTDVETIARDRGWLDDRGKLLVLPDSAASIDPRDLTDLLA